MKTEILLNDIEMGFGKVVLNYSYTRAWGGDWTMRLYKKDSHDRSLGTYLGYFTKNKQGNFVGEFSNGFHWECDTKKKAVELVYHRYLNQQAYKKTESGKHDLQVIRNLKKEIKELAERTKNLNLELRKTEKAVAV